MTYHGRTPPPTLVPYQLMGPYVNKYIYIHFYFQFFFETIYFIIGAPQESCSIQHLQNHGSQFPDILVALNMFNMYNLLESPVALVGNLAKIPP